MLMVIFGAGASYDSLARQPPVPSDANIDVGGWRPPLANQLFGPRFGPYIHQFPQMHAVIPDLQNPAEDVESILERFQDQAPEHPRRLIQLAAIRYYLQDMLTNCQSNWENETVGVTNYKALLDRIEHRVHGKKLLVSFNYDTFLEEALASTIGIRIQRMSDYVSSDYVVVKLHGSINWFHAVKEPSFDLSGSEPDVASRVVDQATMLAASPGFDLGSRFLLARWGNNAILPALSVPVASKSNYECPEDQQKALQDLLPEVDRVLMIGWKAGEKRFLDTLADRLNKRARILVVSSSEARAAELIIKLHKSLKTGMDSEYEGGKRGFSHAITSHEIDEFLKSK